MTAKRALQLLVSLVVGAGCLWLAFKGAPIEETKEHLVATEWWGHAGFVALVVVQFIVRSKRWAIQVHGVRGEPVSMRDALAINAAAFAAVFLFPFRLGEFVRPILCAQRGLMSASAALANSAVERIVDGMVTVAFFGLVLVFLGDTKLPPEVSLAGWGALALFGSASIVMVVGVRWRGASVRFWTALLTPIHKRLAEVLVGMLERFLDGLSCFRTLAALSAYLGLSVAFWLVNGFGLWLLLRGMHIEVGLPAAYFTVCFMVIAVMIPAPPGNLGNFHYFSKLALTLLGVAASPALAFAVLAHGWHVLTLVLWAGLWIATGDISVERLRAASHGPAPEGGEPPVTPGPAAA